MSLEGLNVDAATYAPKALMSCAWPPDELTVRLSKKGLRWQHVLATAA
jgi:hypothetical protein